MCRASSRSENPGPPSSKEENVSQPNKTIMVQNLLLSVAPTKDWPEPAVKLEVGTNEVCRLPLPPPLDLSGPVAFLPRAICPFPTEDSRHVNVQLTL